MAEDFLTHSITVKGLEELFRRSALAQSIVMESLAKGVYREGELVMGRSKDEFVPVETGALKSTGHVEEPKIVGTHVVVEMGYGGPSGVLTANGEDYVGYALYVHEGTATMEGQFYLEQPTMQEAPEMPNRVKEVIHDALEEAL